MRSVWVDGFTMLKKNGRSSETGATSRPDQLSRMPSACQASRDRATRGSRTSRGVRAHSFNRVSTNLRYFAGTKRHDFAVNFIVTKENYAHLLEVTQWLKDVGVDNVRFSPVWVDDFEGYHEPIRDTVADLLEQCKRLETDDFKVYSSYRIDPNAKVRACSKCYFQQVVPVVGADECVYGCHNVAYTDSGRIGSIAGRKFSDLWFSPETKAWFDAFDAKQRCGGIQCAAEAKNVLYNELINARGDNFV